MEIKKQKAELTFQEKYLAFKNGKGEAPILHKTARIKVNDEDKKVIISVEEVDSDGEVVEMMGGRIRNPEMGIPMIDSHNSWDSLTSNGLGAIRNPRFEVIDGKNSLVGEPDFAPTPNGDIARILYMGVNGGKPYFTDVSMGFQVYDYDNETAHIKQWEVFECSLVTAGANRSARFVNKSLTTDESKEMDKEDIQIAKDLARFKQIHEPFKQFLKLFLSDEFCKKINYTKDGDLLVDINNIYDTIDLRFTAKQEAPKELEEAPQQPKKLEASPAAIELAILDAITQKLKQL